MSDAFFGEIRLFAFPRIPTGWLACDGSLQPISQNQALYALLGTQFGGDGVNTFGLPDLRGQVPVHQGTGTGLTTRAIGSSGGAESVALTVGELPAHSHTMLATTVAATSPAPMQGGLLASIGGGDTFYATDGTLGQPMHAGSITPAGSSLPHANVMPSLVASFCICTSGVYPTPA